MELRHANETDVLRPTRIWGFLDRKDKINREGQRAVSKGTLGSGPVKPKDTKTKCAYNR